MTRHSPDGRVQPLTHLAGINAHHGFSSTGRNNRRMGSDAFTVGGVPLTACIFPGTHLAVPQNLKVSPDCCTRAAALSADSRVRVVPARLPGGSSSASGSYSKADRPDTLRIGDNWDRAEPKVKSGEQIYRVTETNRFTDAREFRDVSGKIRRLEFRRYEFVFERPSGDSAAPYKLVKIASVPPRP